MNTWHLPASRRHGRECFTRSRSRSQHSRDGSASSRILPCPPPTRPGERNAIGRARDVVEADLVEELYGSGVAAVLTADPELQVGPRRASVVHGVAHEPADPLDVDGLERVGGEQMELEVLGHEATFD